MEHIGVLVDCSALERTCGVVYWWMSGHSLESGVLGSRTCPLHA